MRDLYNALHYAQIGQKFVEVVSCPVGTFDPEGGYPLGKAYPAPPHPAPGQGGGEVKEVRGREGGKWNEGGTKTARVTWEDTHNPEKKDKEIMSTNGIIEVYVNMSTQNTSENSQRVRHARNPAGGVPPRGRTRSGRGRQRHPVLSNNENPDDLASGETCALRGN